MKEINLCDYRKDVERLIPYISWLETKVGVNVSGVYDGNDLSKTTFSFPVYDSMLLNFINEAQKTELMDENYMYTYSQYFIKDHDGEMEAVEKADMKRANVLCGVLSKYVLGGRTKGKLWAQAVEEGTFLAVLKKMKSLLELWDKPFA